MASQASTWHIAHGKPASTWSLPTFEIAEKAVDFELNSPLTM